MGYLAEVLKVANVIHNATGVLYMYATTGALDQLVEQFPSRNRSEIFRDLTDAVTWINTGTITDFSDNFDLDLSLDLDSLEV